MVNGIEEAVRAELERQTAYLREIASFNRRGDLKGALDTDEKRVAYELSDGRRTSQEVVDDGGLTKSRRTVQRWWSDWIEQGLATRAESGSARARYDVWVIREEGDED